MNIAIFLLMTLLGGSQEISLLIAFGAKVNSLILAGQWWRLLTPMFLHIGLEHLVLNMVTLYFIGTQLETILGHSRFLLIYFISGFMGNLASFAFNPEALSAGASTALFGLFGVFLMMGESFGENPYIRMLAKQFLILIVLNVIFGFYGNVDLPGHLGGLFGGFLAGYCTGVPAVGKVPVLKRILSFAMLLFLCVMLLAVGFKN
ncbi:rhomboid family integral membrane protein [Liquorilactobacillus oeni DSM 19972]|uniref:Rhomboid family integral membrane protein n=1 Tax=Liquorilactobacillus oeni DSM 19972 TaxID=1423777 RepID=A0A0R1M9B3_9LACO|nr:rhomboid family integral membrane protein [Liquorilactobacillus oeni DSM 19972]